MSKKTLKKFGMNILFFNVPTFLIIFLTAHSQGMDIKASFITAAISFLTAFVDLAKKYFEEHHSGNHG